MRTDIAKTWTFPSSSGSKVYETILYHDGSTSCNCFGWTRHCKNGMRMCKHTRLVESDQDLATQQAQTTWTDPAIKKTTAEPVKAPKQKVKSKAHAHASEDEGMRQLDL